MSGVTGTCAVAPAVAMPRMNQAPTSPPHGILRSLHEPQILDWINPRITRITRIRTRQDRRRKDETVATESPSHGECFRTGFSSSISLATRARIWSTASHRDAHGRSRTDARTHIQAHGWFVHRSDPAMAAGLRCRPAVDPRPRLRDSVTLWPMSPRRLSRRTRRLIAVVMSLRCSDAETVSKAWRLALGLNSSNPRCPR